MWSLSLALVSPGAVIQCAHLKMADRMAARLQAQEEQIQQLSLEVKRLLEGLCDEQNAGHSFAPSPELEGLRAENEKLKYRILHLRRGIQAELEMGAKGQEHAAKCQGKQAEKEGEKTQASTGTDADRPPLSVSCCP